MEEYAIKYIDDVKIHSWPRKRGPYLQLLTYFVNFDTPDIWMPLEQVDDCEEHTKSLQCEHGMRFLLERFIWNLLHNNIPRKISLLTNNILVVLSLRGRDSFYVRSE